jgi:hypothetical protein
VATSTKSPVLLHSQFVNRDNAFAVVPQKANAAPVPIDSFEVETERSADGDCQGLDVDDDSFAATNTQPVSNPPNAPQTFAYPGLTHTVDHKWTAALLKVMDDINVPDYAYGLILAWARDASADKYSFHPKGGLDCAHNVTVLVKSIANATQLLPSVLSVSCPHGPPCDVVVFDFVPHLLRLLQNPSLMIPENVVLDFRDPLKPYTSINGLLSEALSGSVYQKAYSRLITNPSRQLLVPIIQWIDRTSVTGNDRFSLKPYMFTPEIFKQNHFSAIQASGYHGNLPKSKTSTAQNQTQFQGDTICNYHAQVMEEDRLPHFN